MSKTDGQTRVRFTCDDCSHNCTMVVKYKPGEGPGAQHLFSLYHDLMCKAFGKK